MAVSSTSTAVTASFSLSQAGLIRDHPNAMPVVLRAQAGWQPSLPQCLAQHLGRQPRSAPKLCHRRPRPPRRMSFIEPELRDQHTRLGSQKFPPSARRPSKTPYGSASLQARAMFSAGPVCKDSSGMLWAYRKHGFAPVPVKRVRST